MARWTSDIPLRLAGVVLLVSAYYECGVLRHHMTGSEQWALTALLFLSATGGTALLVLGRHLNDRITLSARWTRRGD